MTTEQKKTAARDKLHKAFRDEHLETLKKAESEALNDVKNYEYWLDVLSKRYLKVTKARKDFENELKQIK